MSGAPAPAKVTVRVPARLHLGFLDLNGGLGRRFGSIGLAISGRRTSITIGAAAQMRVTGPEHERVRSHIETMRRALDLHDGYDATIDEVVPAHVGLDRARSSRWRWRRACAVSTDCHWTSATTPSGSDAARAPASASACSSRAVSSLTAGADRRRRRPDRQPAAVPRAVAHPRCARPAPARRARAGRARIVRQACAVLGRGGRASVPARPDEGAARIGELRHRRFRFCDQGVAGAARRLFRAHTGRKSLSSPDVAAVLDLLESEGALGIGQSSWGPTGFAFVPSAEAADRLLARTRGDPVSETWTSVLAPGSTAERKSRLMRKRTSPSDNDGKQPARREVRHDRQEHPSHVDTAQAHEPVRREHGIGCGLRCGAHLRECDARG